MKFATTSSLILLACSVFQLACSVPIPAPVPDVLLKRDGTSNEGIIFATEAAANMLHQTRPYQSTTWRT